MSPRAENGPPAPLTREALAAWPLPPPGESKYSRGRVAVLGGSPTAPGAVALAGLSALRVGAGRLTLVVPPPVALHLAVAVPEAGVLSFDGGVPFSQAVVDEIENADAVLIGPGLADADTTERLLRAALAAMPRTTPLVLDAFALGVLPALRDDGALTGRPLVLTPNRQEAAILLGREAGELGDDIPEIAAGYGAVVSCFGVVAPPSGRAWLIDAGGPGLATSGSGDTLAGAILGLAGRGCELDQAAAWGTYLHATAGERLAARIGPVGFLAREIVDELVLVLSETAGAS